MYYVLRKTLGPLSPGTRLEVIRMTDPQTRHGEQIDPGYATVQVANVSKALHDQIKHHPIWKQLLGTFDISADMLVRRRGS